MTFVPALVEAPEKVERPRPRRVGAGRGNIELEINGLAALVKDGVLKDPYSGVVYVFRAKRADRVKMIYWDGTGLWLMAKALEAGAFNWPKVRDGVMRLTPA